MLTTLVMQGVLTGITNGFFYALVGMGMAVIFKGSRIVNAMQGDFGVIGAISVVLLLSGSGWSYPIVILGGALAGACSGAFVDYFMIRPMVKRGADEESYLLLTIGLSVAVSAAVLYFVGRDSHLLPPFGNGGAVEVFTAIIQTHALWLIAVSIGLVFALMLFYRHTPLGLAMMAASIDSDGAATNGINVRNTRTATFILGGLLGAVAGILVTPLIGIDYQSGIELTLKGFAAAILGGLANPLGAVVGGLTLGLVESLAVIGVSSGYKNVIAMTLLIAIMIVLPNGMLGKAMRKGG